MHQDGARRQPIAARAADLLVVAFERRRQGRVEDRAHVCLVDAHAEGDGRNDDLKLAREKSPLHPLAMVRLKPGMVGRGLETAAELTGEHFSLFAGGRVDERRACPGIREQRGGKGGALGFGVLDNLDSEIFAPEAVNKHSRRCSAEAEPKLRDDVLLHLRGRGGGERDDRRGAQALEGLAEQSVIRTEIVPPLRDTVRLVDRDQARLAFSEHLRKAGHPQPLGRDKEELKRAVEVGAAGLARGLPGASGVNARHVEAARGQFGGLVVHERDERRDDERGASAGQRRQLVAERLARAGRHDQQHVAALDRGAAHPFLIRPKGAESETLLQQGVEGWRRGHRESIKLRGALYSRHGTPVDALAIFLRNRRGRAGGRRTG